MPITTVLFDLDGTLLPMDQKVFTSTYFRLLTKKMISYGYEPKALTTAIWAGTKAMIQNDGSHSNEEVFWQKFCDIFGKDAFRDEPHFASFYANEFSGARSVCDRNENAAKAVSLIKEKGLCAVLATNPIFPTVATESRIRWAGLEPDDFALYTTCENTGFCKPNPLYYQDIADRLGVRTEECLMVGNDMTEDMAAKEIGMQVFLLTDCLIGKNGDRIENYPHGDFEALLNTLKSL